MKIDRQIIKKTDFYIKKKNCQKKKFAAEQICRASAILLFVGHI
jgi:hypothetical protein